MMPALCLLLLGAAPPASGVAVAALPPSGVEGPGVPTHPQALAFRPGGRVLVVASPGGVRYHHLPDGRLHRESPAFGGRGQPLRVLLDGRGHVALWWLAKEDLIEAYDLRSSRRLSAIKAVSVPRGRDLTWEGTMLAALALSWDGSAAACVETHGDQLAIRVWRTADGKPLTRFSVPSTEQAARRGRYSSLALSPDGSLLAVRLEGGQAYAGLVKTATGKEVESLPATGLTSSLTFSPDGRWLAVQADKKLHLLDGRTGRQRHSFPTREDHTTRPAFSPDGRLLAFPTGEYPETEISVVELAAGQVRLKRDAISNWKRVLAFSPRGWLAVSALSSPVTLFDLTGRSDPRDAGATASTAEALASRSAEEAFKAMGRLMRSGDRAVSLLRARLRPAGPALTEDQIDALVALADDADPALRARAGEALVAAGARALPALGRAPRKPGVRSIIADINDPPSRRGLIELRGVEVLERLATPEALRLLKDLAGGHPSADLTKEVKAALSRLEEK